MVEIEGVAPDVGLGCAQRTFNATVFAIVIKFYFAHALVLHCKFYKEHVPNFFLKENNRQMVFFYS